MSRSRGVIWLPVVVIAALAALVYARPAHRFSGPTLPSLFSATVPAPQTTPTKGPKMSATRLAAVLDGASSTAIVPSPLHWRCRIDPKRVWDYICSQAQLREVRGFDVNSTEITQSTALVYAGRKLVP